MKKISENVFYVGVNDHKIDLFEGQYIVPNGMAYNSYVIMDENIAVMDTVSEGFGEEWLANIQEIIGDKIPAYLVVQHVEPDHSSNIVAFLAKYPECKVVATAKAFQFINQFYGVDIADRVVVKDGDMLSLGKNSLTFATAPMVHWPEVMVTYLGADKVLFTADAFGKFGALDVDEEWACEARRYYFGIVGKYGVQAQALLKKAAVFDIAIICPLHGPVLDSDLAYYLDKYNIWSTYSAEVEGVAVFYTSVYGNTKKAVELLVDELKKDGCPKIACCDLAREDMAECVEDAFKYGKIVLATTTYNGEIFPFMNEFVNCLVERGYQNRTIGLIENGTWAPMAVKVIKEKFAGCKNLTFVEPSVKIMSSVSEQNKVEIADLAKAML